MSKTNVTLTLDKDVHKWIKSFSEQKGIPISTIVNQYLKNLRLKNL